MCLTSRTMISLAVLAVLLELSLSAPLKATPESSSEVEDSLDNFLNAYYDRYLKKQVEGDINRLKDDAEKDAPPNQDIYETMQGDQPLEGSSGLNSSVLQGLGNGYRTNFSNHYLEAVKNKSKENFIYFLKQNILEQLGRGNVTIPRPDDRQFSVNISEIMPKFLNSTNLLVDNQITEKIRSFYPSCELPVNTDQDAWKDDEIMNLFFNFYISNDRNTNIATATLRLYRLPENGTQFHTRDGDCDDLNSTEEEKLLRVSIYWYTKSLKKRRVKRRLADSKVIPEHSSWVELSVKPAAKAWIRGRNLGLGVLVEDQDGNLLKADKYFKGASCMVGTSTPKPIPTIIIDAARKTNELHRIDSLLGGNSTAPVYSDVHLLPTIDICTLEFPENYTQPPHIMNLRVNACNLRKIHEQSLKLAEKERLERLATLPELLVPSSRHIRHQRQYLANKRVENENSNNNNNNNRDFDPRSRMVGATVLFTRDEWQNYTNGRKFDFSTINR